ncbi:hypothetical protein SBDP1_290050 [Syntrophobacter sp. SbD1]|nr:hypothetical protein SBDP1_290050 [Syntrophobacter sp. SbD1]
MSLPETWRQGALCQSAYRPWHNREGNCKRTENHECGGGGGDLNCAVRSGTGRRKGSGSAARAASYDTRDKRRARCRGRKADDEQRDEKGNSCIGTGRRSCQIDLTRAFSELSIRVKRRDEIKGKKDMKAAVWYGKKDVRVESYPEPPSHPRFKKDGGTNHGTERQSCIGDWRRPGDRPGHCQTARSGRL